MNTATNAAASGNEILFFGLDHLELYWRFGPTHIFDGLDFDNSNVRPYGEYVLSKHETKRYGFKIVFTKDNLPLFAFYKGDSSAAVPTKDYICAYSSAFRTLWTRKVLDFIWVHFDPKSARRFDIAFDTTEPIDSVISKFPEPSQKWSKIHGADGKLETYYIGELRWTANKFKLLRIYDKIADTVKKGKGSLFADYLNRKSVTRIEVEIRRELAKNAELDQLDSPSYLAGIFNQYAGKRLNLIDELQAEAVRLFWQPEKIDPELIQSAAYRQQRTKLFLSYAKELYNRSICPVELLLFENVLTERTKKALWYQGYGFHFSEDARIKRENAKKLRDSKNEGCQ